MLHRIKVSQLEFFVIRISESFDVCVLVQKRESSACKTIHFFSILFIWMYFLSRLIYSKSFLYVRFTRTNLTNASDLEQTDTMGRLSKQSNPFEFHTNNRINCCRYFSMVCDCLSVCMESSHHSNLK